MTINRKLLLLSSSRVHGYDFLQYARDEIDKFLSECLVKNVLFIPYALKNYDDYTSTVRRAFESLQLNYTVRGIHEGSSAGDEVTKADAIFIGGGNTFLLLKSLYDNGIVHILQNRVMQDGVPYIGTSAGTNVATVSIHTTNDMPIVYPPTFAALNLVPFNINPHYLDPDVNSTHKGETREERIKQYHEMAECHPVLGLREGSILLVQGNCAKLTGLKPAILFHPNNENEEYQVGADMSHLL